jgi:FixJ family two-component response regulator
MNRDHVYLIDNDRRRRAQLAEMLDAGQRQLWSFDSVPQFIEWIDYERIPTSACVLTHLTLEPMNGLELLDVFRADGVCLPTVLISSANELHLSVKAARYGGTYVLCWPFSSALLNEVVTTMQHEWSEPAPVALDDSHDVDQRIASLSKRQREVLRQVFAGNGNRTIASALGISIKTVELHRACMMKKMGASSVVALIRMLSHCRQPLEQRS